jgi:uncharacterized Zn finger protein
MKCPKCYSGETRVIRTEDKKDYFLTKYYKCNNCGKTWMVPGSKKP